MSWIWKLRHTGYFKTYTNSSNFKSVCPWHTIILLTYLFWIFMMFLPCILSSEQSACSKNWNNLQPLSRSNQGVSETQLICHLWICVGFNIAWVRVLSIISSWLIIGHPDSIWKSKLLIWNQIYVVRSVSFWVSPSYF